MKKYDFDTLVDRKNSSCYKWDLCDSIFGGKDLLPFWVADTDFPCAPEILEAIEKRAKHPVFGYSAQPDSLKEAIVAWNQKRHQWSFQKEDLFFLPGVVPALIVALHAYSKPGDKVIIQPPVYYPFADIVVRNGRELLENPLVLRNGRYEMDFAQLRSLIKGAKLFILCNPHNPGGRAWSKEELLELGKICFEEGVIVLSDEIHSDIVFKGRKHIPFASLSEGHRQNSLVMMAPSKTFNIAGLMLSYTIVENPELKKRYDEFRQALGHVSSNPFALVASEAAYLHGEAWLDQFLATIEGHIDLVDNFLSSRLPTIKQIRPEATFLTWLDMKETGLSLEEINSRLLLKAQVALQDGRKFGAGGEFFRRFNLGAPRSFIQEGLLRLERAFRD